MAATARLVGLQIPLAAPGARTRRAARQTVLASSGGEGSGNREVNWDRAWSDFKRRMPEVEGRSSSATTSAPPR